MCEIGSRSEASKIHSTLMKDINRIRKTADAQTKMNILRKHQIKLLSHLIDKLLREKRVTKEEIMEYLPKKEESKKGLFKK